jgi:hypothetical protein
MSRIAIPAVADRGDLLRHQSVRKDLAAGRAPSTLRASSRKVIFVVGVRLLLFHIANDGLPAIIYANMFNAHELLTAIAQALENGPNGTLIETHDNADGTVDLSTIDLVINNVVKRA